ncbi:hypothetical protein CJU90_2070 [Yarrowia sp. C11]|nr:hypothetical protein CJU90_2070 [Yarrowia sp. C11]
MRDPRLASSQLRGLNYADTIASEASYSTLGPLDCYVSTTSALRTNASSAHFGPSAPVDTLQTKRRHALDRLKGWRPSSKGSSAHVLGASAGPQISLQPLQCKANVDEPLQQRDISNPRSLAYHANKYSVSDDASIIRRRPDLRGRQRSVTAQDPFRPSTAQDYSSYKEDNDLFNPDFGFHHSPVSYSRPVTSQAPPCIRLSVLSTATSFSLTPTPAPPSATAQTIPCDRPRQLSVSSVSARPRQASISSISERPSTANTIGHSPDTTYTMHRTNTNSSTRSRTSYLPHNPVSTWDDDEDDKPKRSGLFSRFKTSRSFSSKKNTTTAMDMRPASAQAPSIRSISSKTTSLRPSKSAKSSKSAKTPKSKSSSKKAGLGNLGDFEWNMSGYMEGDEEGSDAEIEAALRRVRESESESTTASTARPSSSRGPSFSRTPSLRAPSLRAPSIRAPSIRASSSHGTPSSESMAPPTKTTSVSHVSKKSPVLPPISPAQSLDLGLDTKVTTTAVHNERFENEISSIKPPTTSPNYARDHVANLLRRRANFGTPSTPQTPPVAAPEQCSWDSWKYTSNHHMYQITPPDSTRSSHVYASEPQPAYDAHHSMVLPESPVQLQPMSSTSSSSSTSDQTKWDDISANIALIQQQIQEMSPRDRELARGFAAKELAKPATLVTPTIIPSPTFPTPPARPSRDNVELPDCFSKSFLTMTSSPSVRPLPRRINKLGPSLEESDVSPESSQRSSVSTRLSTAPSSPEPDMRCFA